MCLSEDERIQQVHSDVRQFTLNILQTRCRKYGKFHTELLNLLL